MNPMSISHEIKSRLTDFIEEVWNGGHVEASVKYVAPRYTIHHDPGDPWDQQELDLAGYQDRVRKSRAPFPDQRFRIQHLLAEGDVAIMTWLWSASHRGDLPGFPATGNVITMSGATAYSFNQGRVTGHWQVIDRLGVYAQLRQGSSQA
jgi:steroid delta-isomerase-like uncharacterized protein